MLWHPANPNNRMWDTWSVYLPPIARAYQLFGPLTRMGSFVALVVTDDCFYLPV